MELTRKFSELKKTDAGIAGGKGASLGEMIQSNIPVPDGFVVLADSFERFIEETDINVEIDNILHDVDPKAIHTVDDASKQIQSLIKTAKMPKDIADDILKKFDELNSEFVAVRSSATAEDSASAAWAGQLDSFLNTTREDVLEKVQFCWASLFTPRAIFYRFEKDLHKTKISVAVVVQKMVNSEKSGIAFSVHPVTEDRNQLIIEAGLGLGEAIVSGQITPDSYVVEKEPRRIIDVNVSEQGRGLFRKENGGNEWVELGEKGKEQILSEKEILELSEIIIGIENHYGFPCDIEWAFEDGKFYIVQSRPITTLTSIPNNSEILENEPISLYKKYINTLNGNESFTFTGPYSALFTGFPWSNEKYYKKYYKTGAFALLFLGSGRVATETVDSFKYREYAREIFEKFIKKESSISGLEAVFKEMCDKVDLIYQKEADDEVAHFKEAFDVMLQLISATVYIETFDKSIVEDVLGKKISEEDWEKASHPAFESFEARWAKKLENFSEIKDVQYIFSDYYFIKSEEEIKNIIKQKKEKISQEKREKPDSSLENIDWVNFTQFVMRLRDYRKDYIAKLHTVMALCAQKMYPGASKYELANLVALEVVNDKLPTIAELKRRLDGFVLFIDTDLSYEISYEEYEETKKKLAVVDHSGSELVGVGASKGFVSGHVKIILDPENNDSFTQGDVLVTGMTRPDFVPLMKKASAIITDEGGVTCHAAIVSRELGIPCIIGTKIATKVLKDGDTVEVDAEKGVVKIIKK